MSMTDLDYALERLYAKGPHCDDCGGLLDEEVSGGPDGSGYRTFTSYTCTNPECGQVDYEDEEAA